MAVDKSNGVGTTSRVAGKPRPAYPGPLAFVWAMWRIALTCTVIALFHHFVVAPVFAPALFAFVRGPWLQSLISHNAAFVWLASKLGDVLQRRGGHDMTDLVFFVVGASAAHLSAYISINVFFTLCDKYGWLAQYKIPRQARSLPTLALIKATLLDQAKTSVLTSPIILGATFVAICKFKSVRTLDDLVMWDLPLPLQIAYFAGAMLTNEFCFYWAHRALHELPGLYARIHKQHHEYVGTMGIAAEHAHPLEQATANFFPTIGYCLLTSGTVPMTAWLTWLAVRLLETLEAHSGYDFRGTLLKQIGVLQGTAAQHDAHHTNNMGSFGQYYLDYLFGTMDLYVAEQARWPVAPAQVGVKYF